jgi:hypothetical protein
VCVCARGGGRSSAPISSPPPPLSTKTTRTKGGTDKVNDSQTSPLVVVVVCVRACVCVCVCVGGGGTDARTLPTTGHQSFVGPQSDHLL